MNSSNTTNLTYEYYTLNDFLINHGSTWILDNLQLYPFIIVGPLGFALNMLAFIVYRDKREFKDVSLYVYMRVYCLNSAFLSLISSFNFCYSYRVFIWANSHWAQIWVNYFYKPISKGCYFYGGLLDIAILLDRIAFFNKRVKSFMTKISPLTMCMIALVFAAFIDCGYYFIWMPTSKTVMLNSTERFTVWFTSNTDFANAGFGTFLTFALFILTDVVIMVVNFVLNMISSYYMRKHLGNKLKITSLKAKVAPLIKIIKENVVVENKVAATNNKSTVEETIGMSSRVISNIDATNAHSNTGTSNTANLVAGDTTNTSSIQGVGDQKTKRTRSQKEKMASRNVRATVMVIFMCLASIVEHLIMVTCNYYIFYSLNFSTFALSALANFVMPFRRSFNFIIFYSFNVNFKRVCRRVVGLSTTS